MFLYKNTKALFQLLLDLGMGNSSQIRKMGGSYFLTGTNDYTFYLIGFISSTCILPLMKLEWGDDFAMKHLLLQIVFAMPDYAGDLIFLIDVSDAAISQIHLFCQL